jgi:hypothetical protein
VAVAEDALGGAWASGQPVGFSHAEAPSLCLMSFGSFTWRGEIELPFCLRAHCAGLHPGKESALLLPSSDQILLSPGPQKGTLCLGLGHLR